MLLGNLCFLTLYIVVSLILISECRDIRRENAHRRGVKRGRTKPWAPKNSTRKEWLRCRGMPCKEWEQRQVKLMQLNTYYPKTDNSVKKMFEFPEAMGHEGIQGLDLDQIDGCMWLTTEQLEDILQDDSENVTNLKDGRAKKMDTGSYYDRWDMPIRYMFDGTHNRAQKNIVRNAARHWEEHTCVRFKEIGVHDSYKGPSVIFTGDNTGCHSWVGKMYHSPQQINLQSVCLTQFGIPVHEIGHTLGLWHEQQRFDRDDHVNVRYENLGPWYSQYTKRAGITLNVEYDIGSVMHYSPRAGSKNGLNTMEPVDPLYHGNMGQRTGLSFNDAKIINKAYCSDTCKKSLSQPCQRNGYQDPNNCDICRCPPGFGGKYCETVATSNDQCGGVVRVSDTVTRYITSPNYNDGRGTYYSGVQCNWLVQAPPKHRIVLTFEGVFSVFCMFTECYHWVEVKYKGNLDRQGPRFCCGQTPKVTLTSDHEEMAVIFRSDYPISYSSYRKGFNIKLHTIPDSHYSHTPPSTTTSVITTTTTTKRTTTTTTTTTTPPVPNNTHSTMTTDSTKTTNYVQAVQACIRTDLAFLLDSSGSVNEINWKILQAFLVQLINSIEISDNCFKLAVISFGNKADVNIPFNYKSSETNMISDINKIEFKNEWTNTSGALDVLLSEVYVVQHGDREKVPDVAVLVTDGQGNRGNNPVDSARNIWRNSINIIGIGVGNSVDKRELEAIADGSNNVKYLDSYNVMTGADFIQGMLAKILASLVSPWVTSKKEEPSSTLSNTNSTTVTVPTTVKQTTTSSPTTPQSIRASRFEFECSFEGKSFCGITQSSNDDFDWTVKKGKTPSDPTGPTGAYDGDYYVYIETSSPRRSGDKARIELPPATSDNTYCLTFWYHMYGFHIKTLSVYKFNKNKRLKQIWRESEEKGDVWLKGSVTKNLKLVVGEKIVFEGERGEEYSGDIALDKIHLYPC